MDPCTSTILTLLFFGALGVFTAYWLVKRFTVTITVTGIRSENKPYRSLVTWLGKNIPDLKNFEYVHTYRYKMDNSILSSEASSRKIRGEVSEVESTDDDEPRHIPSSSTIVNKYFKIPQVGSHYFRYQNCFIRLQRNSYEEGAEALRFTTLSRNAEVVRSILESAQPKPIRFLRRFRKHEITVFYPDSQLTGWEALKLQSTKRPLETLALANNLGENLLADVNQFLGQEAWYFKKGIPWRKTYLLHGPPGCGKSSLVKAIAGRIGYDISVLPLTERLTDEIIIRLLNRAPKRSIVLMEEVEAAFRKNVGDDDPIDEPSHNFAFSSRTGATLSISGFYNALDGVGAAEDGLIVFMTSNRPERLDRSLIRPGRVDYQVLLDYPNKSQLEEMFEKFFPVANSRLRERFLRVVKDCQDLDIKVSVAMIQGLLVKYSESADEALENAERFMRHKFDDNNNNSSSHIYM